MDAETIRSGLRCGRPYCSCQRPRGRLHCPAHDDEHPDLSVTERDGRVLVHCFAGCPQEAVLEALRARGLWHSGGWQGLPVPRPKGLLFDVLRFVERYVILPSEHAAVAVALWILHTWAQEAFEVTPYLVIKSAEKKSGKTRLLEVLELLTPRPWRVVGPSEAVLFRKITKSCPTLLLDEGDTIFHSRGDRYEPLRALLNAGSRRGALVPRCVGDGARQRLVDFKTFCPKGIAAIGDLPDTVEDRSIVIRLDRATSAEQGRIRRLRQRDAEAEAAPLREALQQWANAALPKLRDARPEAPEALDGRAADAWEPLLAVADQGGDGWYLFAYTAALALSTGEAREDASPRVQLLADIRRVFDEHGADKIFSSSLLAALKDDEEAPWKTWGKGKDGLTVHALARLLKPFGIRSSGTIRIGDETAKGYLRDAFEDAFSRYLSLPRHSEPSQPSHSASIKGNGPIFEPSQTPRVTVEESDETPHLSRLVTDVTVQNAPEEAARGEITLADVELVLGPFEVLKDELGLVREA